MTQHNHLLLEPPPSSGQPHQEWECVNSGNCQLGRNTRLEIG